MKEILLFEMILELEEKEMEPEISMVLLEEMEVLTRAELGPEKLKFVD